MNDTILARASPDAVNPSDMAFRKAPNKRKALAIVKTLKKKRRQYEDRWLSIRDYQLPFLGEFPETSDDITRGKRKDLQISNGVAWLANQAFAAGIMSGLTPPSRQWFKFGFSKGASEDIDALRVLDKRQEILESFLHRSNFYNAVHTVYTELPFGQAPLGVFSSPETGIRFQPYTVGSYYLGTTGIGTINSFARRLRMTGNQIVSQFGSERLPRCVKEVMNNESAKHDKEFVVWWLVIPNDERVTGESGAVNMPYLSLYWVDGQDETDNEGYLYVGGFEEFPVPTARYQVLGIEAYGKGPGWYAEGEAKALQLMKRDMLTVAELMVKPPMKGPAELQNRGINLIPGGMTYVNETTSSNVLSPVFQVPSNPQWLAEQIVQSKNAIKRIYSADLFLMLDQLSQSNMTAREVIERQQEKLQQLGPVVERLQDEFLSPIIERSYNILERMGVFEPLPSDIAERLQGQDIKIEYISPLAQAQKMSGLINIEQALSFVGQVSQIYPEVRNLVEPMSMTRKYFELLGAPATMERSREEVEQMIRAEQEAQAQAQAEQMQLQQIQAMAPAAQAAKNLTEAANDGNPALQQMLGLGDSYE